MVGGQARGNWIRRLDDGVFRVEQTVIAAFMFAMTVMVFLDVVDRRLRAPDTKLGTWLARWFEVTDTSTLQTLHGTVAPAVYAAVALFALWYCFRSAERERGRALTGGALPLALSCFAAVWGVGWLMVHVASSTVYILLASVAAAAFVAHLLSSRPEGWQVRAAATVSVTAVFAVFARSYFPDAYSWSKEMSLVLLVWVGLLGASVCVHEGKHLRPEAAARLVPEAWQRYVRALGNLLGAAFCVLMTVLGHRYVFGEYGPYHMGGVFEYTQMPQWLCFVCIPITFGTMALRFTGAAVSALLGGDYGAQAAEEGMEEARAAAEEARS